MKKFFKIGGVALGLLIAIQAFNTVRYAPVDVHVAKVELPSLNKQDIAAHLGAAIRIKTISTATGMTDRGPEFQGFLDWLVATYPAAHSVMSREIVGGLTPIYRWQGSDDSLRPVLLTGHYDVVPVAKAGIGDWVQPPFSGAVVDGYVWGRGALDDKSAVVAIMEAIEKLTLLGHAPKRTIYLSFGHDEEIGGTEGAGQVAAHFKEKGIQMEWSLDEGSMILEDVIAGLDQRVASINVAEKGYVTLDITAHAEGGHSALPPRDTAVSALAKTVTKLQSGPVPGGLTGASKEFFDGLGPHFPLVQRILFANQWFYRPLLERVLSGAATTDAMLRSSKAPTMLVGSAKDNILPQTATATVNYRIHPRDSIDSIVDHTREMIDDDAITIEVRTGFGREPSDVSSATSDGFKTLGMTFRQVFGDLIVVPGLTIAGTDSRHYNLVSDDSYRINPFVFLGEDIKRLHGQNERISVDGMVLATQFYITLIKNLDL